MGRDERRKFFFSTRKKKSDTTFLATFCTVFPLPERSSVTIRALLVATRWRISRVVSTKVTGKHLLVEMYR
ncbi:hypothetical protein RP20_CCG018691 [Aedes albopictus]|nr:hypothetical protein RP20_CCG018691 [Aedes albopictus]